MINCPVTDDDLCRLVDEVSADEADEDIRRHVEACPNCRARMEEL